MTFAVARVRLDATVSWEILDMVLRIEGETFNPEAETLCANLTRLAEDIKELRQTLSALATKVDHLLAVALELQLDTTPVWDDCYNLCGDPHCDGGCRVCQEGEEDYEDVTTEKYCRRGKR
jgi:hypothetical protein